MIEIVDDGIYGKLSTTGAVTSLLSSTTAIFPGIASTGTAMPYIVFTFAGGGNENLDPYDTGDVMYYIKAVANSALVAAQIAAAIRAALHEQTFAVDAPWSVYRCQEKDLINYVETEESTQFWHMGGSYRIRLSK